LHFSSMSGGNFFVDCLVPVISNVQNDTVDLKKI